MWAGFGAPQGMLVIEIVIEQIARHLGQSVDAIRAANYYGTSDRNITPYEQVVKDNIVVELTDRLAREAEYEDRKLEVKNFNSQHNTLKKGIALMPVKFGISFNAPSLNQAGALVHGALSARTTSKTCQQLTRTFSFGSGVDM